MSLEDGLLCVKWLTLVRLTGHNFVIVKIVLLLRRLTMKKFTAVILAFVYLTASSGATINMHYCMGKLKSWDFSHKQGKCGTCGMEKKGHKGCCKDEQKTFQLDKDQKKSKSSFQVLTNSSEAIAITYVDLPLVYLSSLVINNPTAHGPPLAGPVSIVILNCNFRI